MTQEEILEGNRLIAEFMGGINAPPFYGVETWDIPNMNGYQYVLFYDSSWDWLMPVVAKIQKLSYVCIIYGNYCNILEKELFTKKREGHGFNIEHYSQSIDTVIEAVYMCIIEFINYYNAKIKT